MPDIDPDDIDWHALLEPGVLESLTHDQTAALLAIAQKRAAEWHPTEKQALADHVAETAFETLYGGAAGGGKSAWILHHAWDLSIKYPGHRSLLLRRTFPELEESLILASLESYDQKLATYKVADKKWQFQNNSVIKFGHMEQAKDRFAYQSAAYELIAFDELTHFEEPMYDYMISRCRTTKRKSMKGMVPHMIAATNPGGIGGPWVKERFIDPAPHGTVFDADNGLKRAFVQARVADNPNIDEGYVARLMAMKDPVERRQLLDGDWEAFEGRFFTRWNRDIHVIEPFEVPDWWPRERGLDWGFRDPFACVWGAWGPDRALYIYREAYEREMTTSEQAELVLDLSMGEKILATYADPSIWAHDGTGETNAMRYARKGLYCAKAMNARISGWSAMIDAMRVQIDDEGVPHTGIYVFDTCTNWIRTTPMLPRSERNPEDCETKGVEDHLADATRYLIATHGRKGREPTQEGSDIDRLLASVDKRRRHDRRYHQLLGKI